MRGAGPASARLVVVGEQAAPIAGRGRSERGWRGELAARAATSRPRSPRCADRSCAPGDVVLVKASRVGWPWRASVASRRCASGGDSR